MSTSRSSSPAPPEKKTPPPAKLLRPDANQAQIDIWARQRAADLKYKELMRRASEAQIPVLNANRFFILIGHTSR